PSTVVGTLNAVRAPVADPSVLLNRYEVSTANASADFSRRASEAAPWGYASIGVSSSGVGTVEVDTAYTKKLVHPDVDGVIDTDPLTFGTGTKISRPSTTGDVLKIEATDRVQLDAASVQVRGF